MRKGKSGQPIVFTYRYALFFGVLFAGLVSSRLMISGIENYGEFDFGVVSTGSHILELATLVFLCSLYILWSPRVNKLAIFFILFYGCCAILSVGSSMLLTSIYASVKGILYVVLGLLMSHLARLGRRPLLVYMTMVVGGIFLVSTAFVVVQGIKVYGLDSMVKNGPAGTQSALFGVIFIFLLLHCEFSLLFKVVSVTIIGVIVVYLNSLSSIAAGGLALGASLLCRRKYLHAAVYMILIMLATISIFFLIESGIIPTIFNKTLFDLKIGSGRFEVYAYVWDSFLQGMIPFFGYGFMADRLFLVDAPELPWAHTAHNSFLSLLLGVGYVAIPMFMFFLYLHLRFVLETKINSREGLISIFSIIAILLFGFTAPAYPGGGSLLVSLAVYLFSVAPKKKC